MLTLRQIEVFRAVMGAQTVVGAANRLKVAQPTVTKTIRRIEDVLKTQLFDRSGGRLAPTAEARQILAEVDRAFEQLEGAIGRATQITRSWQGVFRFGASPSVGRVLVPRAIASFVRDRPELSVHFEILSVSQVLDYLVSGPGEGAVTLFPIAHGQVRSVTIGAGRLVGLVPNAFPQARAARLSAIDLADATLIVFEPHSVHGQMLNGFLSSERVEPQRTHVVRFAETAIGLAEAGVGIAVVDEFSAMSVNPARATVIPIEGGGLFQVYVHRNLERVQSRFMHLLEAALRQELTALSGLDPRVADCHTQ
jgi:DNA-binding transcriptional LysR family regulator